MFGKEIKSGNYHLAFFMMRDFPILGANRAIPHSISNTDFKKKFKKLNFEDIYPNKPTCL